MTILMRLVSTILVIQLAVGADNFKQAPLSEKCLAPLSSLTAKAPQPLLPTLPPPNSSNWNLGKFGPTLVLLLSFFTTTIGTGCDYMRNFWDKEESQSIAVTQNPQLSNLSIAELTTQIHDEIKKTYAYQEGAPQLIDTASNISTWVNQRKQLAEATLLSREEAANQFQLTGEAREIYITYGFVVEGTSKKNQIQLKTFFENSLPSHLNHFYSLIGRTLFPDSFGAKFYSPFGTGVITWNRTLTEKCLGSFSSNILSHEMGHNLHSVSGVLTASELARFEQLHNATDSPDAFISEYAQTDPNEDAAEINTFWRDYTQGAIEVLMQKQNAILNEKAEIIIREFIFEEGGQLYIRVSRNETIFDLPLTLTNNDPNTFKIQDAINLYAANPSLFSASNELIPEKIVDKIIEMYYQDGLVLSADQLYQDISELAQQGKKEEAIETILRLMNSFRWGAHHTLQRFQDLSQLNTLIAFDPNNLQSLDDLEAYYVLDAVGVINWLSNELEGPMQKIRALIPYYENQERPHSAFVTMALLYERYLNLNSPDTNVRDTLLNNYNEMISLINTDHPAYGLTAQRQQSLVSLFLEEWDPTYQPATAASSMSIIPIDPLQEYLDQVKKLKDSVIPLNSDQPKKPVPPSPSSGGGQGEEIGLLRDENEVEVSL